MRLIARIPPNWNQAIIGATIKVPHLQTRVPIIFMIDSGCTNTTLLQKDVIRLQINWPQLPENPAPSITALGETHTRLLNDVTIYFTAKTGFFNLFPFEYEKYYDPIELIPPFDYPPQIVQPINEITGYSLLGMDILRYFSKWKWKFVDTRLFLDT